MKRTYGRVKVRARNVVMRLSLPAPLCVRYFLRVFSICIRLVKVKLIEFYVTRNNLILYIYMTTLCGFYAVYFSH